MSDNISFELWDVSSGNVVKWFGTKHEALTFVSEVIVAHGRRYVSRWALLALKGEGDEEDDLHTVAQGAALAKLAAQSVPA